MRVRLAPAAALALLVCAGCRERHQKPGAGLEDVSRPAARWLEQEPVRLLRDYVRIDTSESKGEQAGARFLEKIFECAGIPTELVCPSPGRCNLLARLAGRQRESALLLLNHIDVAPVYAEFWKEAQPFEGKIKGGYLYGRGAYDMKSIALAQALAIRELKRNGIVPKTDVLFLAEADEESGQRWGSRWLLENRPEWFKGVTAILNEGGNNETILRDVRFWGIETLQAGYAWAEFQSASPEPLRELEKRWSRVQSPAVEPHPHVVLAFDMLANHLVHPLTDPLRHLDRVHHNPGELAALPDRYGSFMEARRHWFSAYPFPPDAKSDFRCDVLVSTPPGVNPDPYLQPILKDASRLSLRIVSSFSTGPTTASPFPTRFTEVLKRVTEARYPGVPFGPMPIFGAYTTSILYRQKGIPAYGYSPIPMNITDAVRRHGFDERIYLRDYLNGLDLYSDLLIEYSFSF